MLENLVFDREGQNEIFRQLGLEMFLTEVNLLLLLYRNGMRHKVKGKEKFLSMAKEYFSKAMQGFENERQAQKTGMRIFNEETIDVDIVYRELLVEIKNIENFKSVLLSYIDTLQNIIDRKEVGLEKIDSITLVLKSITARIRKNHCAYLESHLKTLDKSRSIEFV